jgi:hypothetical protein
MARPKKYPDELIARGVRLALERERPITANYPERGARSMTATRSRCPGANPLGNRLGNHCDQ